MFARNFKIMIGLIKRRSLDRLVLPVVDRMDDDRSQYGKLAISRQNRTAIDGSGVL